MFSSLHWLTIHVLVTTCAIAFYVVTSHSMSRRRAPTAAIAWVIFLLLLPYVALPAYWHFGFRKLPAHSARLHPINLHCDIDNNGAVLTALALGQSAPDSYENLSIHADVQHARSALPNGVKRNACRCALISQKLQA